MKPQSEKMLLGRYMGKVSEQVKDRGNDPYFTKKADEAAAYVRKYGLPEEALKIQAARLKK